nr:myb-like protein X [Ipomoea trifida]
MVAGWRWLSVQGNRNCRDRERESRAMKTEMVEKDVKQEQKKGIDKSQIEAALHSRLQHFKENANHRTPSTSTTTSGELFVYFTSRLSSSPSMKLSKSILSPSRDRDPSVSLSTSLSRRLRTNGSIKADQASPMFPSSAKKRGSAFENPESSSSKVTCIGQVWVKTKKKVKHNISLSKRRSRDLSFRKLEQAKKG